MSLFGFDSTGVENALNIFKGNFNANNLLSTAQLIQNNLNALKNINAGINTGSLNGEALKIFLETKARTTLSVLESKNENNKIEVIITKTQEQNNEITKKFVEDSKKYMELIEDDVVLDESRNETFTLNVTDSDDADSKYAKNIARIMESRMPNYNEIQNGISEYNSGLPINEQISLLPEANEADTIISEISKQYLQKQIEIIDQPYKVVNPIPVKKLNEDGTVTTSLSSPDLIFKSWIKYDKNNNPTFDENNTFSPQNTYSDIVNKVLQNSTRADYPGSYKFFIEQLHGRYSNGVPYKKNPIKSTANSDIPVELTNRMVFSAYIQNYNDSYSSSWNDYNFLGRGESSPIYQKTSRDLTLEFFILADYSANYMAAMENLNLLLDRDKLQLKTLLNQKYNWGLGQIQDPNVKDGQRTGIHVPGSYSDTPDTLWKKITFLAQCCYPYYRVDGKMKEQPFVRIRIADFYDVIATIESLSYDLNVFDDGVMIDFNPSTAGNIPLGMKVTMRCKIFHDAEPSSTFHGFYWRKEFDAEKDYDKIANGSTLLHKGSTDSHSKNLKKNSPTNIENKLENEDLLDFSPGLNDVLNKLNTSVGQFQKNFNSLSNIGINALESILKQKLQNSIKAFSEVNSITKILADQLGISISSNTEGYIDSTKNAVDNYTSEFKNTSQGIKQNTINQIKAISAGVENIMKSNEINSIPKKFKNITK